MAGPIILSVSRRTDVPAFYADWFTNRLQVGHCYYPNPIYTGKFHRVDLTPPNLSGIVFWTRWPKPLMRSLDILDSLGVSYYFQFTIIGYPRSLDPRSPSVDAATTCFLELADKLGPHRVIWRYDPLIFSKTITADWHLENFSQILSRIEGATSRIVLSVVDPYRKTTRRLESSEDDGFRFAPEDFESTLARMVRMAHSAGVQEVMSCAEPDLKVEGLLPGRCIDGVLFERLENERCAVDADAFALSGEDLTRKKISKASHNQRPGCLCHRSIDIGANNSCGFGCAYCYATTDHNQARLTAHQHNPKWNCIMGDVPEDPAT